MPFNSHFDLVGKHAFLSASKYHWINYDAEKLDLVYRNAQAAKRGIELHAFAHEAIRLGIKLPRALKTLNMYVNDAIGYRMTTEQILYYSDNCYGTADTISFKKNTLRIHDLKTGEVVDGSIHQLEIYAAIFCMEYMQKPGEIDIELRIYQHDEVEVYIPDTETIAEIMSKIVMFDRRIELLKAEGYYG
jgi:Protein of unknown function (DUF2800)